MHTQLLNKYWIVVAIILQKMRKISLLLTIFIILTSCNNKLKTESADTQSVSKEFELPDSSKQIINLFKDINPHGLHIYSTGWDKNGQSYRIPFEGPLIEAARKWTYDKKKNRIVYAIGKFNIENRYYGLIVSEDKTSIYLWIFDKKYNRTTETVLLANFHTEEEWSYDTESWIDKANDKSLLKIITREKFRNYLNNECVINTDTIKTNILSNSKLVKTINENSDTIKFKLKKWK
jgi:hypothetical protein